MIKVLLRFLSCLPLTFLHALGAMLGRLAYRFDARYRTRLQTNAAYAGYNSPAFWRSAAEHMGRSVIELAYIWTPRVDALLPQVKVLGWDAVMQAKARGHGVLMLTPHVGAFELLSLWIGQREPFTAMYRPPKQAMVGEAMLAGRQKFNVNMASADVKGIRTMLRALKKGELVGLLPDQVPNEAAEGVIIQVFGQPALNMTLPAKLLRQTDAVLVTMFARRVDAPHRFEIEFNVIDFTASGDAVDDALRINVLMEDVIRQTPEQYLWAYNRYKRVPNAIESSAPTSEKTVTTQSNAGARDGV